MKLMIMPKVLSRFALQTSLALPLAVAPAVSVTLLQTLGVSASFAQVEAQEKKKQKPRKVPSMSESVYKKLAKVQEPAEAEDWTSALAALKEMEKGKAKYNGYELAQMYNLYGYVNYSQERYPQAIEAYKKVLAQGEKNIPRGLEQQTLQTIAQLYFVTENYDQALRHLNLWFAVADKVTAENYYLRSQAYYQKGDQKNALADINKAVSMYEQENKVPKQNWFELQRYFYYDKKNYNKVADILVKLIQHYPKEEYYKQLAGMYGELKREDDMLHMMEAAYVAGALQKEAELLNMAYLFMGADMPYKGAKVIDKGIKEKKIKRTGKNLETLAQAYQQAQELKKSIPELEAAAKISDKGDIYSRLAAIHLDLDENEQALKMANLALKKGELKRPDQLYITAGMANANLKKYDAALTDLNKAKKDKRSERFAKQWIAYVEGEKKREEALAL